MNPNKISISNGNSKMGKIPSVSLPPVVTCPAHCPCAKKCYALKLCKLRPTVRNAYQRNLDILNSDDISYWCQVKAAAVTSRFFRFHVSGDIPDSHYFGMMTEIAKQLPRTQFLAFTKQYSIVNNFIDMFGDLPKNLHIIFSEWGDGWNVPNPHNLPTAAVIFKGQEPKENWKICGGNCSHCASCGIGCWELKKGETIAFYEH